MAIEIVDLLHLTGELVEPTELFELIADEGGFYSLDISGDFTLGGNVALQTGANSTVRIFTEPGHWPLQLDPASYRFLIDRVIDPAIVVEHVTEHGKLFAHGGHTDATHPARMNDATFVYGWLERHGFSFTPAYHDWRGTLTPAAAAEILDRHLPPLSTTPSNLDPSYAPRIARLALTMAGHVFDGAADLAYAVARNQSIPARIALEG